MSLGSDVIGSVAAALAVALLGAAGVQGRRLVARARSRRQDDHQLIRFGSVGVHMPPGSAADDVRVVIICAPSHTIRDVRFDPGEAVRFVKRHFAEEFPHPPSNSGSRAVKFEHTPEVFGTDYLWVNASGRLDLGMTVSTTRTDAGRVNLNVLDLLQPIALVAAAVGDRDYWRVFGVDRAPRQPRFDWMIGTSIDISDRETGWRVAWDELTFPGRVPSRASGQRPFCPPAGFAADEMRSRRSDESIQGLLRPFLTSFLTENGYHDIDGPIDDVLSSWQSG